MASSDATAERTAKEKVVDAIYAAWGAGKFNDPEACDAEFVKYFTEDASFKCSAPQDKELGGKVWHDPDSRADFGAFFAQFGPEGPALVKFDLTPEPLGIKFMLETPDGNVHVKQLHTQTCLATGKSITQVFYQEWKFDESGMCMGCLNTMGNPSGVDEIFKA
jgi:hypothetical protein